MELLDAELDVKPLWDIEDGLGLCRKIEAVLGPAGFHCALGGGVMKHGESEKDLDVFIYPHKKPDDQFTDSKIRSLLDGILDFGIWDRCDHTEYGDAKDVFTSSYNGKRVDVFLVQ